MKHHTSPRRHRGHRGSTETKHMFRSVIFTLFFLAVSSIHAQQIPVILSTDVGNEIDDQWAVAYLLVHPRFNVLGIMSAHAPTITAPAGQTSHRILVDVV